MKIIFMGTPEFSCPTLQALIADPAFEIVAIYTREPKISGRGHKVTNSPIHNLGLQHDIKVITPKTLKTAEAQAELINLNADAAVVVAYGLILPKEVLTATKFGCINIHPSLLPRWRGAAPIQRTIMSGDKETAIAIMQMDEGVDSGDVLSQEKFALTQAETYTDLAEKFSKMGADLLVKTLKDLENAQINAIKQDDNASTYAKKIDKLECEIDWKESAEEIERKIRGLNGCLGAYLLHNNEKIKIFEAEIINKNSTHEAPGSINSNLEIQCGKGIIRPLKLQRPGKKPTLIKDFLLGFKI